VPGLLKVGLTGGIACGRTTLSRVLAARPGWLVLDADQVAHALMAEGGAAVAEIRGAFGEGVEAPGGGVDRKALGRIVFSDPGARRRLERILHPRILDIIDRDIEGFGRRVGSGVVVVDAALMVETGTHARHHRLVVAHCPRETQLSRLMARDRMSRGQAEARIAAQAPLEEKMALADYLIDTSGTLEETARATSAVADLLDEDMRSLPGLAPRRSGAS